MWISNPWWRERTRITNDAKITEWENSSIKYDPRLRYMIYRHDFEPDNTIIYTLRGLRQVGKTTLIKLQIRDFLNRGVCPWNIFYYSFDLVDTPQHMVEVIESYLRLSREHRKKSERTHLFLDEVTSVKDWQRGIKWLVDNDRLRHCTVMATGSQAAGILHATERLPGRRGRTKDPYDNILLPMKFSEFVDVQDGGIRQHIRDANLLSSKPRMSLLSELFSKNIPSAVEDLYTNFADELDNYLLDYLVTGGIPKIVDTWRKTGFIAPEIYTNYLNGIKGDWSSLEKSDLLKHLCNAIIHSLGSSIAWEHLKTEAQLGSATTAQNYVFSLKDLLIVTLIYRYGEKNHIPRIRKEKKFYLRDPFFLHAFRSWSSTEDPFELSNEFLANTINQGKMVESVVADHLIRLAFSLASNKQGFDYSEQVLSWKDEKKREVDFVLCRRNSHEVPIEVKYRRKVDSRELGGIGSFLNQTNAKSGIVLSRNELEKKHDYLFVPTSVFLLLI